ncbi:MAG TPA: cellulose binding domain-containing protein [Bacillota bacterium]|nr:cellulose binding domain-containing protein [Bacillota bacterium]
MKGRLFQKRSILCTMLLFCMIYTAVFVYIQNNRVMALENGLARTPPMGWNCWNCFGSNINETIIKQIADAMVSSGMKDAGYQYIVIDDTWQASRDSSGNIVPDATKFPSGMKSLADYVHLKGLKLGLYSDRGTATCCGKPGSYGYEVQDANTYASWGIDYVKYDNCSPAPGSDAKADYTRMRDALLNCGRPIVYSICAWWYQGWEVEVGNLWRTTSDINDNFGAMLNIMEINNNSASVAGPGHWNDPDMLEVGNGGMTTTEYQAHFGMWAIMAAPLIAGNDLRSMTQTTIDILTNSEVIAVDQDAAGIQGTRVVDNGDLEVWCKPLGSATGNTKAVALLNRSASAATMTVNWSNIGLSGTATVRDLWAKADRGSFSGSYSVSVPSHGVAMLKIAGSGVNATPTPTARVNATPTSRPTPTLLVTSTQAPTPTSTQVATVTPTPTRVVSVTPTRRITATPSRRVTPTRRVRVTPTFRPSSTSALRITPTPTSSATTTPTQRVITPTPQGDGYVVSYVIQNDWGAGATINVTIINNTVAAVNGWTLAFTFPGNQTITNLWNGTYTQSGASVSVKDGGFNASISANGGSVNFGFNLNYSGTNAKPTSFTLNGTACRIQ